MEEIENKIYNMVLYPNWYKIKEINIKEFCELLKEFYKLFNKKEEISINEDPFIKNILTNYNNISNNEWKEMEIQKRYEKNLTMKIGYFHQNIVSKFNNYETLPLGHHTGCDARKKDKTEYFEIKNRDNTMNFDSSKSVEKKLIKLAENGKNVYLVLINTNKKTIPRFGFDERINVINGKQFYEKISGRKNFYDDLLETLGYIFKNYKNFNDLKEEIL